MSAAIIVTTTSSSTTASTGSSTTIPDSSGSGTTTVNNVTYQTEGESLTMIFELSGGATLPSDVSNVLTWGASGTPAIEAGYPKRVSDTELEVILSSYTNTTAVNTYTFTVTISGNVSNTVTLFQGYRVTSTITATVTGSSGSYAIACSPDSIDVTQGSSLTVTLNLVNSTGENGTVVQFIPGAPSQTFAWQGTSPDVSYTPTTLAAGATTVTAAETNINTGTGSQSSSFHVVAQVQPSGGSFSDVTSTDPTLVNLGSSGGVGT